MPDTGDTKMSSPYSSVQIAQGENDLQGQAGFDAAFAAEDGEGEDTEISGVSWMVYWSGLLLFFVATCTRDDMPVARHARLRDMHSARRRAYRRGVHAVL
jgi:hypothetical protein